MIFLCVFAALVVVPRALTPAQIAADARSEAYPPKTGVVNMRRADETTLVLHFRDGYVIHHRIGQKRSDEKVVLESPLSVLLATDPANYTLASEDDPAFRVARRPIAVARKSKGTDFAWFADRWVDGRAVNDRPDHASEHWIYLHFPTALKDGRTYRISAPNLGIEAGVRLDSYGSLSDSIHVNLLGYGPDAPQKFGYLYAWEGDGGSMDVQPYVGRTFEVVNADTGEIAFSGKVSFRFGRDNPETGVAVNTPKANFLDADVAECDFSGLARPGHYYLDIGGIGRSRVFSISPDVFRPAFKTVMMGILGSRSGIDLEPPHVPYHRPAPHNPMETPGFQGKLKYTTSRWLDRSNFDSSPADTPAVKAGILGDLDVAGWYQDAGDWDSYETHIAVPQNLMLAYQLAPNHFSAGELNLPDRPSPLPDILKEAEWLPGFCYRLRHQILDRHYGTGGLGLRICGDYFGDDTGPDGLGRGSWQDTDRIWTASGEDPVSTFGYAGIAANFALCLKTAKLTDPGGIDWRMEAVQSFDWAEGHTRQSDATKPDYQEYRRYALAGLALLTGEARFDKLLLTATADYGPGTRLWWSALDGPALYLVGPSTDKDPVLVDRFRQGVLATADAELDSSRKRALRWGGDWGMPMLVGQQTTPWVAAMAVANVITRDADPVKSRTYFGAVETTADYFLGTNPLNQTWVSGLGPQFPRDPFSMDSWYEEGAYPRPGIVPYGPWRIEGAPAVAGPWDRDWANKTAYPVIDQWPGAERWFNNRCCPMTSEFTIHQNMAPSALVYGFLCGSKLVAR